MSIFEFPPLLVELMNSGRWKQPSDETIKQVIPFLQDPVIFLLDREVMQKETSGALALISIPKFPTVFHMY